MHYAAALILTTHNQFLVTGKQQLTRHRINTIISGRDHHLLTRLETIRIIEHFIRQSSRRGVAGYVQGFFRGHIAGGTMTETQHPRHQADTAG